MINKPPELASDLDWMLQSGQVNQDVLAEALIDAWFDPIFRLSRAFLKIPMTQFMPRSKYLLLRF